MSEFYVTHVPEKSTAIIRIILSLRWSGSRLIRQKRWLKQFGGAWLTVSWRRNPGLLIKRSFTDTCVVCKEGRPLVL